jgi:hypothetical protein
VFRNPVIFFQNDSVIGACFNLKETDHAWPVNILSLEQYSMKPYLRIKGLWNDKERDYSYPDFESVLFKTQIDRAFGTDPQVHNKKS